MLGGMEMLRPLYGSADEGDSCWCAWLLWIGETGETGEIRGLEYGSSSGSENGGVRCMALHGRLRGS
jgi:hypothetical protein